MRKSIGVSTWRRGVSRSGVRARLRLAFVGVVLVLGAQDPRPFAGEPSGGLSALVEVGAVRRGSGAVKDRREGATGRGDRTAGRGRDRSAVAHG